MSKLIKILCEEFGIPQKFAPQNINSVDIINKKMDRAKKMEEVDTVAFGLETDDNRIIKVYVKSEQADDFEEALSKELGGTDVIEDVLNKLSNKFDIVDVEWPDQEHNDEEEETEDTVGHIDMDDSDDSDDDGSKSLDDRVWNNSKNQDKHLIKKENKMSFRQNLTKHLLDEISLKEAKRFVTKINGKEKIFMAFDEKTANNMAKKWGGDSVSLYKGHTTGGPKKKVVEDNNPDAESIKANNRKYKVGMLDQRFSNMYQFMIYQAILDLGIPDESLYRSGQKNQVIDSIKAKARELQRDPVRRQALRMLTKRLKESSDISESNENTSIEDENKKEADNMKVGALDNRFTNVIQKSIYLALLNLGIEDSFLMRSTFKNAIISSIKNKAKEFQKDAVKRSALRIFNYRFDLNENKSDNDIINESTQVIETLDFIVSNLIEKLIPEDEQDLIQKLKDSSIWKQIVRSANSNSDANRFVSSIHQYLVSISRKISSTFKEELELLDEAKWGEESMFDDDDDKPVDRDSKIKMPRRKKDKRIGEETAWEINKKSNKFTLQNDEFTITLDDESVEKLIKAISTKSIVILLDSEESNTKWVFSPRARTLLVKKVGQPSTVKPKILSVEDINSIEDVYISKK